MMNDKTGIVQKHPPLSREETGFKRFIIIAVLLLIIIIALLVYFEVLTFELIGIP